VKGGGEGPETSRGGEGGGKKKTHQLASGRRGKNARSNREYVNESKGKCHIQGGKSKAKGHQSSLNQLRGGQKIRPVSSSIDITAKGSPSKRRKGLCCLVSLVGEMPRTIRTEGKIRANKGGEENADKKKN